MQEFDDQNNLGQESPGEPAGQDARETGDFGGEQKQPADSAWTQDGGQRPPGPEAPRYGAPYSPEYHNNTYPDYPPRYGQDQGRQPCNPYQYNANSGWQQQPQRPPEKYEWKFEDYDQLEKKKSGKRGANRGLVVFTVSLLGFLSVGLICLAVYSIYSAMPGDNTAVVEEQEEASAVPGNSSNQLQIASGPESAESALPDGKLSIPQVAEAVLPSVVGVIKYDNDQYFETSGYGSGIVMSEDGYIITNAHVVAGGTGFKVQFTDGDAYDAEMVGYDSVTDLAVLKIPATGLTPAQFGDSDSLKVGETVVAIGNPGGDVLASSVTQGIISAINREVMAANSYRMTYIQTDAAINPGNSGGALVNEYGLVIGINSAKISAPDYEGIGFAIPIATAKPIVDDIIANGKVTGRVVLGVTCRMVDEITARNTGMKMGLMIDSVEPTSDLTEKGVLRGDILTHIDGERIYDFSDVRNVLDQHKPGDTVTLTFYRKIGTREQDFDVQTQLIESQ